MSHCANNTTPSCKCKKTPCSCEDQGLHTSPPCAQDTPECPNPEPCPETFSDCCVVHANDTIVDLDIKQGDRLCDILQKMTLLFTNPGCILPGSTCLSVLGLMSTTISPTTIGIKWQPSSTATQYITEYKLSTSLSWTMNPPVPLSPNPVDTIGGLLANTEYDIRVAAICLSGTCYSVTIRVKTAAV
jgi:hypothetical protein